MGLGDNPVRATVAVTDIDRAAEFYEGRLGLAPIPDAPELVRMYECGGAVLQVYASPEHAGKSTATVASWSVSDFEGEIDALIDAGVEFEHYDEQPGDSRGVHTFGDHKVAWCRDPDGNTIAIDNGGAV